MRVLFAFLVAGLAVSCSRGDADEDGFTVADGDCDDSDASAHPDADEEPYNGVDDDCDADTLDDDLDGDGFDQEGGGDCDDSSAATFPGADDIPNDSIDQDCSGSDVFWVDADGDGFASMAAGGTDCDDADNSSHPGAYEECDTTTDNNCDGDDDGCDLFGSYPLTSADHRQVGPTDQNLGYAVAILGDVDGNGQAEVAAGAPYAGAATAGAVFVTFGRRMRQHLTGSDSILRGEATGDVAGFDVADAGDVNDDGKTDLLVGAPLHAPNGLGAAGAAYLELGPLPELENLSLADAKISGDSQDDWVGYSVAGAGDVNQDGFDDILVGAPLEGSGGFEAGAAFLFLGPVTGAVGVGDADAKLVGPAGSGAGVDVAGAGDVDNDGFDDVLVAAWGPISLTGGVVFLVRGPVSGTVNLSTADAQISSATPGDLFLCSVAGVGDLNADGFDDFVIGAPRAGDNGVAYVFHGPVSGAIDTSTAAATVVGATGDAGWAVSGAGDFNADGFPDLLVGERGGSGAAHLVYGPISGTIQLTPTPPPDLPVVHFGGEEDQSFAGGAVAGGGDIDGDGLDDVIIGAYGLNAAGTDQGAWYLWYGRGW